MPWSRRAGQSERRARLRRPIQRARGRQLRGAGDAASGAVASRYSAAYRVFRHLDHSGQRNRGLDGRVRSRPHEERGVSQVPYQGDQPGGRRADAPVSETLNGITTEVTEATETFLNKKTRALCVLRVLCGKCSSRSDDFAAMSEVVLGDIEKSSSRAGLSRNHPD